MKKVIVVISALILFAGLTFAQTPQTQDKSKSSTPAKKEVKKSSKENCDPKNCTSASKKSGCCSHDGMKKEEKKTEETTPEKK